MNNILEMLEKSTALYPEHPALSTGEAYLSYQEVTRQARCVGSAIASLIVNYLMNVYASWQIR